MAEAVGQLENGEDQLALQRAPFLLACLEGQLLNHRGIRCRRGKIFNGGSWFWLAAPTMSKEIMA